MKALLLVFTLSFTSFLTAQSLTEVTQALGRGDVATLSSMMGAELDLSLPGEQNLYASSQATQKLDAFFAAHKPTGFSQVHQGSSKSDSAEYLIGNLSTADGPYRVYIYIERQGGQSVLRELRFDKE